MLRELRKIGKLIEEGGYADLDAEAVAAGLSAMTSGLWLDFLGGLYELGSDHSLARIPADLPILITGGGADPVGGEKGMTSQDFRLDDEIAVRKLSRVGHCHPASIGWYTRT